MATTHYTPAYEFGQANPAARDGGDFDPTGQPYTDSPATSHTYAFRYFGTDEFRPSARNPLTQAAFQQHGGAGRSFLEVVYRLKNGGPGSIYRYFFSTPGPGREIFEKMRGSPHPYGEVVKPLLIDARIPYTAVRTVKDKRG